MRLWTLLLAACLGGVLGAWLHHRFGSHDGADPAEAGPRDPSSYYLRTFRADIVSIEGLTPLLLSPLDREIIHPNCPERMVVRTGRDGHAGDIRPYVAAVGPLGLPTPSEGLAAEIVSRLEEGWSTVRDLAAGPVGQPHLRVLVKHYPRPKLPGACYTVEVDFYTVPDPLFDASKLDLETPGRTVRGLLFEWRKTWQTEGPAPRVIEAVMEVQGAIEVAVPRSRFWDLAGEPALQAARDERAAEHFEGYAGGKRYGLAWFDASCGRGPERPHRYAYRIYFSSGQGRPRLKQETIGGPLAARLRELVQRL
jgi:hypothetical protein